jgi:hypothetical protein
MHPSEAQRGRAARHAGSTDAAAWTCDLSKDARPQIAYEEGERVIVSANRVEHAAAGRQCQ